MSNPIDWREYEARKAKVIAQDLPSDEYDRAIAQIVEDLDSESDLSDSGVN